MKIPKCEVCHLDARIGGCERGIRQGAITGPEAQRQCYRLGYERLRAALTQVGKHLYKYENHAECRAAVNVVEAALSP